jgi:threonine dehydrogenase-like Zn-dependent dehydrogenase
MLGWGVVVDVVEFGRGLGRVVVLGAGPLGFLLALLFGRVSVLR